MVRWEVGSDFHFVDPQPSQAQSTWPTPATFFGSGRDAMRCLLAHGATNLGWKRLWVPIYFCQEVVAALRQSGLEVVFYLDGPLDTQPALAAEDVGVGDVVLLMNYFGLRHAPVWAEAWQQRGAQVLEDHTHDPWSSWAQHSCADWCVASLRKTLPVPDGSLLWSPQGQPLPTVPTVTAQRQAASLRKYAAMVLKTLYLAGEYANKQEYRALAVAGEQEIGEGHISGMPAHTFHQLDGFPVLQWRALRRQNVAALYRALAGIEWVRCIDASGAAELVPFGGILLFDSAARRDQVQAKLIAANVYPAVLWSLADLPEVAATRSYQDFSRRMLMVHCDFRYGADDMQRVATLIAGDGEAG